MPQRTLRFRIKQDGRVEESVEGALGSSCYQLTEKLEEALGSVENREATSEAFLQPQEESHAITTELKSI